MAYSTLTSALSNSTMASSTLTLDSSNTTSSSSIQAPAQSAKNVPIVYILDDEKSFDQEHESLNMHDIFFIFYRRYNSVKFWIV